MSPRFRFGLPAAAVKDGRVIGRRLPEPNTSFSVVMSAAAVPPRKFDALRSGDREVALDIAKPVYQP